MAVNNKPSTMLFYSGIGISIHETQGKVTLRGKMRFRFAGSGSCGVSAHVPRTQRLNRRSSRGEVARSAGEGPGIVPVSLGSKASTHPTSPGIAAQCLPTEASLRSGFDLSPQAGRKGGLSGRPFANRYFAELHSPAASRCGAASAFCLASRSSPVVWSTTFIDSRVLPRSSKPSSLTLTLSPSLTTSEVFCTRLAASWLKCARGRPWRRRSSRRRRTPSP